MIGTYSFDDARLNDGTSELVCAVVGAATGAAVGVMAAEDWYATAALVLVVYVLCSTFPVVMIAYEGGLLRGLVVAMWSLIYALLSMAAMILFMAILALPLALLLETGPGRTYQEWFPNTWMRGSSIVLEYVLAAAALSAIFGSDRASDVAAAILGGLTYGWNFTGPLIAGIVGLPLIFLCGATISLFDGWPPGWPGITLALVFGSGAGAVHGYFTGSGASIEISALY